MDSALPPPFAAGFCLPEGQEQQGVLVQTRLGGSSAPLTPEQAAEGIFRGIEAQPETGKFWNVETNAVLA